MTKFKKGDLVYKLGNWNDGGKWFYELVTITSWGKKQGTYTVNNTNAEDRIYTDQANTYIYGYWFFPADEIDPEQKALELAAEWIKYQVKHSQDSHDHWAKTMSDNKQYMQIWIDKIEQFKQMQPSTHAR